MKKAFALVEVVVVLAVVPVALLLTSRIFASLMGDMPKDVRLLQQNTSVLDMTRRIAEDMDRAEGLPDSDGTLRSDAETLLIRLPDAIACYQRSDEGVTRTLVGQAYPDHTWRVPDAAIAWQRRQRDGRTNAVELQTHLQRRVGERTVESFANSHVYFVGGIGKGAEVE